MLLLVGGFFDILLIFLAINYICAERYRFHLYDPVFFVITLIIPELINSGLMKSPYILLGYALLGIYVILKFHPGLWEFIVDFIILFSYMVAIQLFFSIPIYFMNDSDLVDAMALIVNICSCLITVYMGRKRILWKLSGFMNRNGWVTRGFLICCGMGIFYLVVVVKFTYSLRIMDHIIFGAWTVLICFLAVMWQKSRNEVEAKDREMELQKTYEDVYQNLVQSIRRRQHEFDNHIMALCGIYKTVDTIEELIRQQSLYCKDIARDNHYNKLLSASSPVFIGFLYSKFTLAEEKGCEVDYHINITENDSPIVPEYHIVEILGILLDNALEALEEASSRMIYVEVLGTEKDLRITVKNTSSYIPQSQIANFTRHGFSTKGEGRGIGLFSLKMIVDKFGGELAIYNEEREEENWLVFNIEITNKAASQ